MKTHKIISAGLALTLAFVMAPRYASAAETIAIGTVNGIASYSCPTTLENAVTIAGAGTVNGNNNAVTINWGDGTTSGNIGSFNGTGNSKPYTYSGTHTYASSGTYTVTIKLHPSSNANSVKASTTLQVCIGSSEPEPTEANLLATVSVVNTTGTPAAASDFQFAVTNASSSPSSFAGNASGTAIVLTAGSYSIAKTSGPAGYTVTSNDCSGTLAVGANASCTIVLTQDAEGGDDEEGDPDPDYARLTVYVQFVGGTGTSSDALVTVTGSDFGSSFPGSVSGTVINNLPLGAYLVTGSTVEGYDLGATCSGTAETDGQELSCTLTYTAQQGDDEEGGDDETTTTTTSTQPENPARNGRSGSSVPGQVLGTSTEGEVLGATTACSALITSYLRMGAQNPRDQVLALQGFLNEREGTGLPVTGVFGGLTRTAVMAFQQKYAEDILMPWVRLGLMASATPSGVVYKTTQAKINNLACADLNQVPQLP